MALQTPNLLCAVLIGLTCGCSTQSDDDSPTPPGEGDTNPTMPMAGQWNLEQLLSSAYNGCHLAPEAEHLSGTVEFAVTDASDGAFTLTTVFNLNPTTSAGSQLSFSCELLLQDTDQQQADAWSFRCGALAGQDYQPDEDKDAVFSLTHTVSGRFNLHIDQANDPRQHGWSGFEGAWTISLDGPCAGADCEEVWSEVPQGDSPDCASSLEVTSVWAQCGVGGDTCVDNAGLEG